MPRFWPVTMLIVSGVVLMAAVALGAAILIFNLRSRALAESERELKNTALILAEQIDRSFKAAELVQLSLIEQIRAHGITSNEQIERQMSGHDVHLMLRDKISGLPHVDAVTIINAQGRLVNFSRYWPIPAVDVTDRDYYVALKSDPRRTSFVSEPVRNRATGTWTIYLARRVTAPNGDFIGLVLAAMQLAHFEISFGSIALGNDSAIALFRGDGTLLARHPRVDSMIGRNYLDGPLFQNILLRADHGSMRLISRIDGRDRLVSARNLDHFPVAIAVSTTISAVLAGWREDAVILAGVAGVAISSICAIVLVLARRLSHGRKLSTARRREEKLKLDSAVGNMSQGLLMFDSSKRIVVCNRRYIEMYGLSPEIVKPGCTVHELISHRKQSGSFAGDVEQYCAGIDAAVAQGTRTACVVEAADGRSIHIVNQPMANGGWVATHEDVTEKVQAERAVRESERKFSDLFEFSPDGLVLCDQRGTIQFVNRQTKKLFGYESDELIGRSLDILVPREQREGRAGLPDRYSRKPGRRPMAQAQPDIKCIRKDGTVFPAEIVVSPIQAADEKMLCAAVRDITEQRQHEATFRLLFDGNPLPMYVFDVETLRFLAVNDVALVQYGYSREQFLAMTVLDIRPVRDRELFLQALRTFEKHQQSGSWQHLKSDGTTFEADVYSRELTYDSRVARFAVVIDNTERRNAEKDRDRNREFLNQIIDNVPMAIFVKEAGERRIVLMNRATEALWGVSRSEALGKRLSDLFPKAHADRIAEHDDELLQSGSVVFTEAHVNFARPDDGRLVTSRRLILRAEDGTPQYLISVVEDVTSRKRLEKEHDENRRLMNLVIENIPSIIILRDARELRYVLVNRAGEEYFGVPRNDLVGKTVREVLSRNNADVIEELDRKSLASPMPIIVEHELETPDRRMHSVSSKRLIIPDELGEPQYILAVVDDVTERKSMEQQLQQAQKMEAVGNLTGGLAHDFNNLLTIIIGNLDLLRKDIVCDRHTEQKIETILQASERGAELTRQLLAFARRQSLQPKRFDVSELVEKVANLLRRTLGEDIRIDLQQATDLWSVFVDEAQLEAALVNIAINARYAMPNGGILAIKTCNIHVDADHAARHVGLQEGDHVAIEVSDTGIGMPPEVLGRIFEPFFTTRAPGKGSGLGLSMVYGFMKQSGGHVSASSRFGNGTTFKLLLPRAPTAQAGADEDEAGEAEYAAQRPVPGAEDGEVILAVDDNPLVREIAAIQLRDLGYRVLEAENTRIAMEILNTTGKIDLLFTDIVMPGGVNGKQLAEMARSNRPDLKVLFTSGYPGTSESDDADLKLGHSLLSKPYRKYELAEAVRRALEQPSKSSALEGSRV